MDRDKLLGPPKGHDLRSTSHVAGGAGKRVVGLLLFATLALAIAVAYLIGQSSVEVSNPNVSPAGSQPQPVQIALTAPPPFEAAKVEKPVSPKLVLSPISAPDWKKLGMGCACTFEVGKNALFIAGGDDLATRTGIAADQLDQIGDLVDMAPVGRLPVAPLLAVNRAEVAIGIGPFVPDADLALFQPGDVGVAAQEPQ